MTLHDELKWRGLISQATHDDLWQRLENEAITLYCGFDPTAASLHIGNLLPIMGLVHYQRAGHSPIALIGGGTGMVGDPSGKTQERQLLTPDIIERNQIGVENQLRKFLDFDSTNRATVVNNIDWLGQLRLVEFLRDIGKHFSVNVMLAKESVRARIEDREHGISFTEFTYQLLQAYDFLQLYDEHNCRLQIGGSDQWGNIVAGMDLTRRMRDGASTFGMTMPLVTKSDGSKFGKSEQGNIWLDPELTSPYRFYQFWVNAADSDVGAYLRYFTLLDRPTIEALDETLKTAPEKREAQRSLAEEVTRRVHGDEALANAQRASQAMFGGDLNGLDDATLEDIFSEMPSTQRPRAELDQARPIIDVLVESGIFKSKGEARRMIQNGGLYLNNERATNDTKITQSTLASQTIAVIRKGKKNYHLLKFT